MNHLVQCLVALLCGVIWAGVPAEALHTPNGPNVRSRLQISRVVVIKGRSLVTRPAAPRGLVNEWMDLPACPPAPFSLVKEFIRTRSGSAVPFSQASEWLGARTGQPAARSLVSEWIGLSIRSPARVLVAYSSKMLAPVEHPIVTSRFGRRIHPVTFRCSFHDGVDFDAEYKDAVLSVFDGVVTRSGKRGALGISVEVLHPAKKIKSIVGHLAAAMVKPGQIVKKGQLIGLAGSTGRSVGTHVHLTVRNAETGQLLNPLAFMDPQKEVAPWRNKARLLAQARTGRSYRVASAGKRIRTSVAKARGKSYRVASTRRRKGTMVATAGKVQRRIASRKVNRSVAAAPARGRRSVAAAARKTGTRYGLTAHARQTSRARSGNGAT